MGSGLEPLLGTWGHIVNNKLSKIVIHMLESGRHYGKKEKQIREEIGGTGASVQYCTEWSGWASLRP